MDKVELRGREMETTLWEMADAPLLADFYNQQAAGRHFRGQVVKVHSTL